VKVLMTADTVGGVWTYACDLARALGAHGVEVALATMGAPLSGDQRATVRALSPGVTVYPSVFKLEWMDDPWDDVERAGDWLLDLAARVQPDVVHLNGYAHGALPWRAPRLVVGHSCVLSWWEAVHGSGAPAEWEHYRQVVRRGLQAADLVIAPTRAMLAALERHYGPLPAARVVPNGRRLPTSTGTGEPAGTPTKEPFVLTAGRLWDEAKNVAALAKVAPHLPWPVYVAGDAAHPGGGQAALADVQYLGWLTPTDLAGWLVRAAIYCLPARYEPFGLSALEAGLAHCALVLGDIPSLREVWGDAAIFVPPNDPTALELTLGALMADTERREGLAAAARARALTLTPERMAGGYVAAYADLLDAS
jgi:glycogen(starch) synthase